MAILLLMVGCSEKEEEKVIEEALTVENEENDVSEEGIETEETENSEEGTEESTEEGEIVNPAIEFDEVIVEELTTLLFENLEFAQNEDFENYLSTLASEIRENEDNIEQVRSLFENFDLEYEILNFEVLSIEEDHAVVKVVQKTVATYVAEGWEFTDSIVTAQHTFIKEEDGYKFFTTEVLSTEVVE